MTEQLAQTQADLVRRGAELEQAKSYLERILAKMSSGVIVLNNEKKIISANSRAFL
jgi:nitrogen fixation/metabolism regulation signal transduction histidine kinase